MSFLLDTDTCIYWLRGHESVRQRIEAMKPGNLAVSMISLAELHYGADCSDKPEHNHKVLDDFAATALAHDLILVTNNLEHFERIENLQIEDWVRD